MAKVTHLTCQVCRKSAHWRLTKSPDGRFECPDCAEKTKRALRRRMPLTIAEIQERVSERYRVTKADIIGPTRIRSVTRPRQIGFYLAKRILHSSTVHIGRRFGGRDHSTVMFGIDKVAYLRICEPAFDADLRSLMEEITG